MRLLACGGRDYDQRELLFERLDQLHAVMPVSVLIEGGARGADELAGQWAEVRGIERIRFPADWKRYGRSAGPRRNQQMLVEGAARMVRKAEAAGMNTVHARKHHFCLQLLMAAPDLFGHLHRHLPDVLGIGVDHRIYDNGPRGGNRCSGRRPWHGANGDQDHAD